MKLTLHGQLKDRFGPSFEIHARSVADALEGFSRQMIDFPRDMHVEVVGYSDEAELYREDNLPQSIDLIPAMFGGGGKFTSIIIGTILVVGGFLIGGPLGVALIAAGIPMILNGVVNLFMKAPTISKANDPPASKYLGNGKNTTAIGTPISCAWGKVKLSGHWTSLQVDAKQIAHGVWPENPA